MGNLAGVRNVYGQINFHYDSGSIAYKGAVGRRPYDGTDRATMYRIMGRLGKGFSVCPNAMVTPYVALGYQHWNRHLLGPYGYTEDYSALLVGMGVKGQYALTNRLVLGANAELLAVTNGQMTPHLFNGLYGTAHFGTTGEEVVGLDANYRLTGHVHLFGGLEYTHYNYTGGPLRFGALEPSSSTNLFDLDAGVAYAF